MTPLSLHLHLATSAGTASLYARIEWMMTPVPTVTGTDGRVLVGGRRLLRLGRPVDATLTLGGVAVSLGGEAETRKA